MARLFLCCLFGFALSATAVSAAGYDDFAQGLSAANRGDNDLAIKSFTAALADGDLNASLLPVAYFQRALAYLRSNECTLALTDLNSALKLKSDYVDADFARGRANICLLDYASAVGDFTQAITLQPSERAYRARGWVHWIAGDFSAAATDYAQAVKLAPKSSAALLWLDVSRLRAGTLDVSTAAREVSALDLDDWPEPIFNLYIGKWKPEDVEKRAGEGDAPTVTAHRCESNFYMAEWWLAQQRVDDARPLFEYALKNCPRNYIEYSATQLELKRLK